ncbi:MAG: hypothetical protein AB8F78_02225 [Saprospiraceae bacterium]
MKLPIRILSLVLSIWLLAGFGVSLFAQSKALEDAEKLAVDHQYADAVRLLELAMIEGDTSEVLMLTLADYYKKTGNLRMATALCKPLVDKDRPRPWHLLEVATMLVDQGRITDAEPYLLRFEELKPEDVRAARLRERAMKRRGLSRLYPGARLDTFLHNTLADDGFPFRRDSQIYWSSDRTGSKKTSGWTGRAMVGLYETTFEPEHGLGPPTRIDAKFNKGVINTASPCVSPNGEMLLFTANATDENRKGELNMQLFYATRKGDEWKNAERIPTQQNQSNCLHPTFSADGNWLYYAADAADSKGGLDLYRMAVNSDGTWGRPDNLGSTVNTEKHDGFPVAASDGKLYFASKGHIGLGGFDLFVTEELANGKWSEPINLGEPVNSEFDETGWFMINRNFAYLTSNRIGEDDDIYEVRW